MKKKIGVVRPGDICKGVNVNFERFFLEDSQESLKMKEINFGRKKVHC